MEDRAPDCATPRAAAISGIIAAAVMAGEMHTGPGLVPEHVVDRLPKADPSVDFCAAAAEVDEGFRVAGMIISARARASVRTPSQAALSGAEAALALAEDALDPNVSRNDGEEVPDLHAVLASIRDTLRAGLRPLHEAEAQAPYDAGPSGA